MSYLIIDNISLFNIQFQKNNDNNNNIKYNVFYNITKNIKLNGLYFKANNNLSKKENFYFLKIEDINLLKLLNHIDDYFHDKFNNYIKFIRKKYNSYGIIFNFNHTTNIKYNYYKTINDNNYLYLNLKYINNNYNNNYIPIIYLL